MIYCGMYCLEEFFFLFALIPCVVYGIDQGLMYEFGLRFEKDVGGLIIFSSPCSYFCRWRGMNLRFKQRNWTEIERWRHNRVLDLSSIVLISSSDCVSLL